MMSRGLVLEPRNRRATKGRVRDGLLRRCRPDGNRLEGYTPSSLVTRFQIESQ
jgi:hypothetical protein